MNTTMGNKLQYVVAAEMTEGGRIVSMLITDTSAYNEGYDGSVGMMFVQDRAVKEFFDLFGLCTPELYTWDEFKLFWVDHLPEHVKRVLEDDAEYIKGFKYYSSYFISY